MALPPSIPTSFVPHSASGQARRFRTDYTGAFAFFCYIVLTIAVALAIGVFAYGRILSASKESKDAELAKAESEINQSTVEGFVRLRNRLVEGQTLLNNHVAFTTFFSTIGTLLPTTVRLSSLHTLMDSTGPRIEGSGVAKSFNALAAASTALSKDGRIKDIIFSNINISSKDNSVAFTLTATLDPKIIAFMP
jgi:hypothetical protein